MAPPLSAAHLLEYILRAYPRGCNQVRGWDAYVSWANHKEIIARADPIFGEPEEVQPGNRIRLYIRGGTDCIGEEIVNENGGNDKG